MFKNCIFLLIHFFSIEARPGNIYLSEDTRPMCPCGKNESVQTRVVGGHDAGQGHFPFASGLLDDASVTGRVGDLALYCGATLITDIHVLTAAHCVRDRMAKEVAIDVGDYDLHNTDESEIRAAQKLNMFPDYRVKSFHDDIAVVEFENPINWQNGVRAAWLPPPNMELEPGTHVSVYGWGRLNYSGNLSRILQTVELPIIHKTECQKEFDTVIEDNMICAGGDPGKDACMGDSGSGLVARVNNDYVLYGVVSFGRRCALPHVPGVYTRVSNFTEWIVKQTVSAHCKPCIYDRSNNN